MSENKIHKIGSVLRFGRLKGFGFIKCKGIDEEIFVHHSNVISLEKFKTLHECDMVEFDLDTRDYKAYNVQVIKENSND